MIACEQQVEIMNFCRYSMATYIFQAFYIFSQPTGGSVELLQYVSHFTFSIFMPCKFETDQSTANKVISFRYS